MEGPRFPKNLPPASPTTSFIYPDLLLLHPHPHHLITISFQSLSIHYTILISKHGESSIAHATVNGACTPHPPTSFSCPPFKPLSFPTQKSTATTNYPSPKAPPPPFFVIDHSASLSSKALLFSRRRRPRPTPQGTILLNYTCYFLTSH